MRVLFFPFFSYLIYDGHGSVRALADESGIITDSYTYDAFGIQLSQQVYNPDSGNLEPIAPNNAHLITDNSYLYAGEYFDTDLGLYYLRARHMNPETGRFHTLDEYEGRLGEPLSLHKYMYAHANPVMGIDPSGYSGLYTATCLRVYSILLSIQATFPMAYKALKLAAEIALPLEVEVAMGGGMGWGVMAPAVKSNVMPAFRAALDRAAGIKKTKVGKVF
jgi:RHS repeat-associated protein